MKMDREMADLLGILLFREQKGKYEKENTRIVQFVVD